VKMFSVDEFYTYGSEPVSDLMCNSAAETLSHLLPDLFGEELCYYEDITAFEMKRNWSRQLKKNNSVQEMRKSLCTVKVS